MLKKILKLISINLLILALIFICLELIFAKLFPEFRGQSIPERLGTASRWFMRISGGWKPGSLYKGYKTPLDDKNEYRHCHRRFHFSRRRMCL